MDLRYLLKNIPKVYLFVGAALLVFLVAIRSPAPAPAPSTPTPPSEAPPPLTKPPAYKVYRQPVNDVAYYIIAPSTTDEQLRSLLWSLRTSIESGNPRAAGLVRPTSNAFGVLSYRDGLIAIYRGTKCVNEDRSDDKNGPCGYGDHAAATYHWGMLDTSVGHSVFANDVGILETPNGEITVFEEQNDHWHPSSSSH